MRKALLFQHILVLGGFLGVSTGLWGQSYDISGVVTDDENQPLESATVYLQSQEDQTVIDYTITKKDGKFSLQGKTNEPQAIFKVSYVGYADFEKEVVFDKAADAGLQQVILKEDNNTLDEVTVQGTAPPIRVQKDTLEFNVSSFKTKEGANLEDLLKKLPGVTVSRDGSIEVNGKSVSKIKVNGKDFFSDDPKIATKNLPKDLLQKIQVVDTKSKEDEFVGRESDSDDKTINVIIREEDNRGLFSRMTAGAGTDHRFSLNGIANYFKNDLRLSALGSANNINSIGFSFDEVYDAMGRNAYSIMNGAGSSGITKSHSAGLDFVDSWKDKTDLSVDYFYDRASTETASEVQRENILPNRHYFNNSSSTAKNVNNNHRGNVYFEYKPDTLTRISIRPNITANNGFSQSESYTESLDEEGRQLNQSTSAQHSKISGVDFSNRLDVIRKYGRNDGYVKLGFSNRNGDQQSDRYNFTSRDIFDQDGQVSDQSLQDQLIASDRKDNTYTLDAGLRVPLSKAWKLDADYTYTTSHNTSERLLYEHDGEDEYDLLNEDLSSSFISNTEQHKPRVGVVYRGENLSAGLSGGLESIRLKNKEEFTDTRLDNTYNNLFARLYVRYRISQMQSMFFNYSNSRDVPSVTQLQPVTNTTDPLNIITGNPNLKPTLTNRFSLNYNNYDYRSHQGMFAYVRGTYNTNQIVAKTETDENLVRSTTYTNVDGGYDFSMGFRLQKEFMFKDRSSFKPQLGANSSLRKDIGFSNAVKYHSNTFSMGPSLNLEYDIPDIINIDPSYSISYNQTKYGLGNRDNQKYTDHTVQLDMTTYWPEDVVFGSTVSYSRLGETAPGFDKDFVLWNMSLGYKLMGDDGVLKLTVYDLLNQNNATARRTGEDYVQDTQDLVLKRYFMLSFTYKVSKFGGKKSSGFQGGGRGGRHYYRRS